jgi:DNA invertase Pin-like site-specific DNA recombinase
MQWIRAEHRSRRAVAYYRHSAQDRQENSVEIQQDQVRAFAQENGIEIIREFADRGKSGLSTEGRHEFNEMIRDYVEGGKEEIDFVLALDVSRWGRFQDTDLSAYYTGLCSVHGIRVVFTTIGFPRDGDLLHGLQLSIERYRAASYSRELSTKVFKGCVKIAEQGFRAGGPPPYAMRRLLLDETRKPVQALEPGQHKSIQNQRVTLMPGDKAEVKVVKRIFRLFVVGREEPKRIAALLNRSGVPSPGGAKWTAGSVLSVLRNEVYAGTMVYNRTTQRLKSPRTRVPPDQWIRAEHAFPAIIPPDTFREAGQILIAREEDRRHRNSEEGMASRLGELFRQYGTISSKLVAAAEGMASPATYAKRFRSLDLAYNRIFEEVIARRRAEVIGQIRGRVEQLDDYGGFIVLNDYISLHIQPSVPFPYGYDACWTFRPVMDTEVDITLGVPLTNGGTYAVMGYLLFARLLCRDRTIRFTSTAPERFGFHSYDLGQVVDELAAR